MNWQTISKDLKWQEFDPAESLQNTPRNVYVNLAYLLDFWQELALRHQQYMEVQTGIHLPAHQGWMIDGYHIFLRRQEFASAVFPPLEEKGSKAGFQHRTIFCPTPKLTHYRLYQSLFFSDVEQKHPLSFIAEAQVGWFLVDLQARRPVKEFPWRDFYPVVENVQPASSLQGIKRYRLSEADRLLYKKSYVFPSEFVDDNQHINHRAYFLLALEALMQKDLPLVNLADLLAVFRQEVLPDEEVDVQLWQLAEEDVSEAALFQPAVSEKTGQRQVNYLVLFVRDDQEKCRVRLSFLQ